MVLKAHIAELQRQNAALLAENIELKAKLAKWPGKALEHALKARASERERLKMRQSFK